LEYLFYFTFSEILSTYLFIFSSNFTHTHIHARARVVLILGIHCEISKTSMKLQNSVIGYKISKHKRYIFWNLL